MVLPVGTSRRADRPYQGEDAPGPAGRIARVLTHDRPSHIGTGRLVRSRPFQRPGDRAAPLPGGYAPEAAGRGRPFGRTVMPAARRGRTRSASARGTGLPLSPRRGEMENYETLRSYYQKPSGNSAAVRINSAERGPDCTRTPVHQVRPGAGRTACWPAGAPSRAHRLCLADNARQGRSSGSPSTAPGKARTARSGVAEFMLAEPGRRGRAGHLAASRCPAARLRSTPGGWRDTGRAFPDGLPGDLDVAARSQDSWPTVAHIGPGGMNSTLDVQVRAGCSTRFAALLGSGRNSTTGTGAASWSNWPSHTPRPLQAAISAAARSTWADMTGSRRDEECWPVYRGRSSVPGSPGRGGT